jgi:hypothetical protein
MNVAALKPMACARSTFHQVDPSFTAFDPRNAGLPTTEPVSERRPRQLRVSPRLRQ